MGFSYTMHGEHLEGRKDGAGNVVGARLLNQDRRNLRINCAKFGVTRKAAKKIMKRERREMREKELTND
jgi:hypothetical protein